MHPSYSGGASNPGGQDFGGSQDGRQQMSGGGGGQGMPPYYQGAGAQPQQQHSGFPGISHGGTMQSVAQQNYGQQPPMPTMPQQHMAPQSGNRPPYSVGVFNSNPPPSNIGIAQNAAAQSSQPHSMAQPSLSSSSSMLFSKEPKKQLLVPPPYPDDVLDDLPKLSVGMLTTVGKEIVHDLNLRTFTLCGLLKTQAERKNPQSGHDPNIIIDYCTKLFDKLAEIRVLIDKRTTGEEKSLKDLFNELTDMSDPVDDRPEELKQLREQFDENKKKLTLLNSDLKMLDWMATVSDPGSLKRVDKMSTSFKDDHR